MAQVGHKSAQAAAAPTAPSAKPGTKDVKAAKPEKKQRVFYPGLEAGPVMEDGKPKLNKKGKPIIRASKKLAAVPADFDIKLHKPLTRDSFEDESLYFELKAQYFDKKAAELRSQAADVKALGSVKDRGAAKKLLTLQKRMAELTAELEGKGVDLTAIKAKIAEDLAKKAAQKTTAA